MPRPATYNIDTVLDRATTLFWQKGFDGTSMHELVTVTGMNKHSMYAKFGSKEGLYNATLERYEQMTRRAVLTTLKDETKGMAAISAFLHVVPRYIAQPGFKGCMMVNSTLAQAFMGQASQSKTREFFGKLKSRLTACLGHAQQQGDIPAHKNCDDLADFLLHMNAGLMVMGKVHKSPQMAEKQVEIALVALKN